MFEKVRDLILENFDVEEGEIKMETHFSDDLNIDSLDLFEFVMALEEKFSINIPSADLTNLTTIDSVCRYIEEKQQVA